MSRSTRCFPTQIPRRRSRALSVTHPVTTSVTPSVNGSRRCDYCGRRASAVLMLAPSVAANTEPRVEGL